MYAKEFFTVTPDGPRSVAQPMVVHDCRQQDKSPLITIVVSTFNPGPSLAATLQSIRNQDFNDYELIVADGGSSDGTTELLAALINNTDCWFSEPDSGIYDAWNKAIGISRGGYFIFLGAGDSLTDGALSLIAAQIRNMPHIDLWLLKVRLRSHGRVLREYGGPLDWRRMRKYMSIAHTASLQSRRLFHSYGLFDATYRICGDYEFLLRVGPSVGSKFVDFVFSEMEYGGVSYGSTRVFTEYRRAKQAYRTRSRILLIWDDAYQRLKFLMRRTAYRQMIEIRVDKKNL